jgi:type I restriction enzyme S subunit
MEVRLGYKLTEVGVIPEEWVITKLGDLIDYTKGYPFKSNEYVGDGTRVIRVSDTTYDSIRNDNPVFVANEQAAAYTKWRLNENDLIVSTVGSKPPMYNSMVGKVLLIQKCNEGALLNQNAVLIRDKKRRAYVQHILLDHFRSKRYLSFIESIYRGNANQASITLKELFEFRVPMAIEDDEQHAIATALNDVDALLRGLERLLAKKRDLKQAAMQQLLTGQTRLPGFHGEWDMKRLEDIGVISGAGVDKKTRQNEMPVRLLNYMDVYKKDFLRSDDFWHQVSAKPDQVRRCSVQRGDIFFTPTSEVRDDIGHSAVATEDIPDVVYSYHVVRLRLFKNWDVRYRAYAFKAKGFMDQASTQCEGSGTRYVITLPKFRSMTVRFPVDVKEQAAIATVLFDMDAELSALEARRDKTRALKQAMMQELLTGKTRLIPTGDANA